MKAFVVVVVEVLMLGHPIMKLIIFKSTLEIYLLSSHHIQVVFFEDGFGKFLHQVMNACCLNFHIVISNFNL